MQLAEKGRFAPPPTLPPFAQAVAEELAALSDVHPRTHWLLGDETQVDGADFYVGVRELGHIHLEGEAHIAVSRTLRDRLVSAKLAKPLRWSEGFVVVSIRSSRTARRASAIFRLAYDQLRGASEPSLVARVDALGAGEAGD